PKDDGKIVFENVSFKFPGAVGDALLGVSFTAEKGKMTAIVGSTGAGKTSLVNLIPRFYDVTDGRVLVNGVDVRNVRQEDLRGIIGYVPQKALLFSGTIESNIKYAGGVDEDAMQKAAQVAQAANFIEEKGGYEDEIAQGGANVSGGQRQRLAIARAIAKKPNIYIFDDSFSALDYKTDSALRAALQDEARDATLIVVAQRINTIKNADQIIVLDEGRVVGIGNHKTLLKDCDVYKQIAQSQLSREEMAKELG
ncbi:MAG: ABC transporter ATP-binding protein/permease, partial [Defluviitaleaceae bacterium]|nr:ABC transporter ATP-binding protein/permease [Defluviitaleaceae bacterium]